MVAVLHRWNAAKANQVSPLLGAQMQRIPSWLQEHQAVSRQTHRGGALGLCCRPPRRSTVMESSLAPLVSRPHSSACTSMRSADQPLHSVSSCCHQLRLTLIISIVMESTWQPPACRLPTWALWSMLLMSRSNVAKGVARGTCPVS